MGNETKPNSCMSPDDIPFVSTPTSSRTPCAGNSGISNINEKLTRSALRREFLFEEEDDDYIMPCSQLPNPSANGQVFWNYNASPATARAREVLEKKMRLLDDEDRGREKEQKQDSGPSPLLTIPMFPVRKAVSSTSDKEKYAKELKKKNETDAMLNSMKQIFQAELQKHEEQIKTQIYDEGNDGKISSSGSSTERMSDSHLQCSSNGSPLSSESTELLNKKSKISDQFNLIRSENENRLKESQDINKSLEFEGLGSDDDSFLVRASQAVELLNSSTAENESNKSYQKTLFQQPKPVGGNIFKESKKVPKIPISNFTSVKSLPRTNNTANLLPSVLTNSTKEKYRTMEFPKVQNNCTKESKIDGDQKIESQNDGAFGDDDEFDTLLSQMEMPRSDQQSKPFNPGDNLVIRNTQKFSTAALSHNHVRSTLPDDTISESHKNNTQIAKKPGDTGVPKLREQLPSMCDNHKISKPTFEKHSALSMAQDTNYKRFKSAPCPALSKEKNLNHIPYSNTSRSFGRRSYSTPDTASSHNQLPGGRDLSVKLSNTGDTNDKPKCTKEEIEHKRLEALKKREIERKRQEAIKKRQLNSQKYNTKAR